MNVAANDHLVDTILLKNYSNTYIVKRRLFADVEVDGLEVDHVIGRRHLRERAVCGAVRVGELDRLDLVVLVVLDIDPELGLPAERRVHGEGAQAWLRV